MSDKDAEPLQRELPHLSAAVEARLATAQATELPSEEDLLHKHYLKRLPHLRAEAEARLIPAPTTEPHIAEELLHELQVHQIELEMQNEELRRAYAALEESRDRYMLLYEFAPIGYLNLSANGQISEANLTSATLFGENRKKLINHRFAHYVAPENGDFWQRHFQFATQHGGKHECELTLKRAGGTTFHARLDCLYMETNASPVMRIAITDIAAQKQAEKALLDARQRLENQVATTEAEKRKIKDESAEINNALDGLLKHR